MPTPPYAKVLTSIAGDTAVGGVRAPVAGSSSVQFSGESTVGWTQQRWELYAYPAGFTAPAGWTLDGSTQIIYSTAVTPPSFTLPAAATRWGKWLIRLLVNEGVSNSQAVASLKDETAGVSVLSPKGQVDTAALEAAQFDAFRGWVADYQRNLRIIEPQLGGGGGSTPTGTGFVHVTGGVQDGAAALVQNADVGASAAIALSKLGIGAADEVVTTNTGATAIQSRKIVDANVATGAAIAVTKLATATNGMQLTVSGGVPTWVAPVGPSGTCGGTEVSLAVGGTTVTALAVGNNTLVVVTGTGATTIQGMAAPSPAFAKRLTVWNDTNATITFANENAGASAADRVLTGNGADDALTLSGKRAEFIYSVSKARWGKSNYPP